MTELPDDNDVAEIVSEIEEKEQREVSAGESEAIAEFLRQVGQLKGVDGSAWDGLKEKMTELGLAAAKVRRSRLFERAVAARRGVAAGAGGDGGAKAMSSEARKAALAKKRMARQMRKKSRRGGRGSGGRK